MNTSERGVELIKACEGLRLKAYPDPASGGAPWTIGYGCTEGVSPNMVIGQPQAEAMLREELCKVEAAVARLVRVPLSQCQFDALVCFTYNVGQGNLAGSTLLRKLNAGDIDGAAEQFARWDKAAGAVMPGLVKRRQAERALFEGR
ncbi:lysozyme [Pseudomonas sp. KNUC1026]|uniref:lysozyme n=1 Tax=Pseudomonas sp. KNUC1026 TaxID=2893890 RepID=UPI001F1998E1|nr:lysozyme [Pseudomonas sp. KNUC1026]UFH51346.1 lysozyme [Pseudomonas sp. KNUC1026]